MHSQIRHKTEITRESHIFAQKVARSITEIQQRVDTVADILLFLELQAYDDSVAKENGYESLHDLAKHVYPFIDMYSNKNARSKEEYLASLFSDVQSLMRRIPTALVLMFSWIGSFLLLLVIGVALWLVGFTSQDVRTMIMFSSFLGLTVIQGSWNAFNVLFSLHYSQGNIDELKRLLTKTYTINGIIIGVTVTAIIVFSILMKLPESTVVISAFMCMAIALHQTSIMIMYALKKLTQLMVAYAIGLLAVFLMFYALADLLPVYVLRYAIALVVAFGIPSAFTIYNHYKLLGSKHNKKSPVSEGISSIYSAPTSSTVTLKSRFGIQMWETTFHFLYGLFFFILIFEDRFISWIYNDYTGIIPSAVVSMLSFQFNTIYHIGADISLTIMLLTGLVQYLLLSPLYEMIHNKSVRLTLTEISGINKLLRQRYKIMIISSIVTSITISIILYLVGPDFVSVVGGTKASLFVLHYSCIANTLLSIFIGNSQFMVLIGKVKHLAILIIAAVIINGAIGFKFASLNFEYAVFGYLIASIVLSSISTVYLFKLFKNMASALFARFV
jgi:hypothetical protein